MALNHQRRACCAWLGLFFATPSFAAPEPGTKPAETTEANSPGELEVDLGFSAPATGSSANLSIFSPRLRGRYFIADDLDLRAEWGFVIAHVSSEFSDSETQARVGDPVLSARLHVDVERVGQLELGVGLGVPLPRSWETIFETGAILASAAAMDGLAGLWRWQVEVLSLFLPLQLSRELPEDLRLTLQAALAAFVAVDGFQKFTMGVQASGTIARVLDRSWFGLRVQVASGFVNTAGQDTTQISLAPVGRWDLGPWYLHGRMVLNLDPPLGFASETGGIWGLFVGAGVNL